MSKLVTTSVWFLYNTSAMWRYEHTTQSFRPQESNSTNLESQVSSPCYNNTDNIMDSDTAEQVRRVLQTTLLPSLALFGMTTNVINCIVFARQGLKDRINLCLFSLALADLCFLVLIFSAKFFSFLGLFDKGLEDYWSKMHRQMVLSPTLATQNISNLLTMFISVERCICVVSPFTAKKFLKTRYMAAVILIMSVYILGIYSLQNLKHVTAYEADPTTNTSSWVTRLSDFYLENRTLIKILYSYQLSLTIPSMSLLVVIVATSITIVRLRQSLSWRQQSVSDKISEGDKKEVAATKMLTVICLIYVSTMSLSVTQVFFRELAHGYDPTGKYCNLFIVIQTLAHLCEVTNSSVNFIVYFTMGTRFRDTVRQLCGTRRKEKESSARALSTISQKQ